jgi:hypothetical protein
MTVLLEAYRQVQEAKPTKATDYLVVEDSKKPSTWHLPVKRNGKPDHDLMGAAWAALHEGHRGNKYQGPDKAKALSKLKALYKSEGMDVPTKTKEYDPETVAGVLAYLLEQHALVEEEPKEEIVVETGDHVAEEEPLSEFVESVTGTVTLSEDLPDVNDNRAPLLMNIALIQPGWGNKKDMHYYPGDMLKRDAPVFEGAKMYATDHHQDEKSVRTEVAVIQSITGYTDTGAPIGRVAVHDPDFAEATRNRARLGTLETLECSILARGKTRKGEVDGKTGHIVESITEAISVDFVTKAGAGGHAINLAEGGEPVDDKNLEKDEQVQEEAPTQDDPPEEETPEVTMLEGKQVQALLSETNLPAAAKTRVAEMEFRSEDEAKTAIQAEITYVKELTGSGDVSDLGEGNPPDEKPRMSEAEYQAAYNRIQVRHGMEPIYEEVSDNVN